MANNDLTSADAWESATNDYLKNHAAQVGSSLYSAANVNPDKAARAQAVGRSLGIPASSAMAYPDETERQVKLQEANPQGIVTTSPVLAQHLTDQNTANIMHDDIPNASGIEQALRTQKPAQNGLLADIGVGLKSSANQIFGALGNSLGHMSVLEGVNNYAKSLGLKDGLGLSEYLQEAQKPLDDTYTKSLRDGAVNAPNRWTGNLASGLAYAPFGPAAPGVAALTSKAEAKQNLTDQGVDAQTAEGVSNAQGIVQGGAFLLPMGQFAFGAGARALAKSAAQAAVKSGAAGAGQSVIGDSVAQQILEKNGYGDLAKQYAPTFEKAWDSALFMAGAHLGMQGVHGVLTRRPPMPAELVQESINAQNSEHDSQVINAVGDAAATSKWRVRDPDTQSSFKQFVGDAAQGTGHESIYIEGKTFEQALDKEGISPDELRALMPDVAKQMNESLQTDGYVRIPMEDYATHMAGTELDKGLRDHMKLDPDSMTTHERQAFYQDYQERMKEDALKAISEQSTIDEFQASRDRVRDQVQKELAATGRYPSDIGKTNATIKAAIVARIAAAEGISPEEAYKRHGAKIVSEPIRGGFEQATPQEPNNLIAQHNLSSENLLHAEHMGGLPVPSLAVTTKENPIKGFGDITLLADKGLIDPKNGAKVFGSDIYSPRYPSIEVKLDRSALKNLNSTLKEFNKGHEVYSSEISSADDLTKNAAFKKYAESKGINSNEYHALKELAERTLREAGAKEKIFKGYNNDGYRQYTEHTIDNVVKVLKKDLRGGENFNFGVGSIRSKVAPQFKSIEQIRKSKESLVSEASFEKIKDDINNEFIKVAEGLQEFHPASKGFGFLDTVSLTMQDAATMGLPRALKENGFNEVSEAKQKEVAEFMGKLRNLPTSYFEAKILRSVGLHEFKGAVVPHDADPRVLKALQDKGITDIKTYQSGDEADRTAKIGKFEHLFFQDARGSYEPESKTIAILKDADLSTFNHEVGHWALDTYSRLATDNPVIKGEMDHLLKWFGVDSLEKWNGMSLDEQRPYHEQFAKGFETYLMEGKAPSIELQPIFARIKQWMISVYQSLDKLGVPLTDEVRGVYQRMMASEEAIRQAESARVFEPLFKDKPEGVSDTEWSEYQSLGQEATDQAVSDMQAKSLRDMKWLRGAKSRALKEVQKQEASARREVKMQVTKEVMSQPVYRAWTFLTARHGDLVEGKPTEKKSKDAIDPENDDLFTAIAKLGGLSHEAVEHAWGVSEGERKKMESGVFGKPVVRKTGGLEIDEMAERLAREGYLTEDEHGKSDIAEFEEAFDAQRRGTPRYSMARDLRDAYGSDWQHIPDLPDMGYGKLRTEDLRYLFGEGKDEPWRKLSKMGMTSDKIGLDADVISEMIGGFNSGKGMVKALIEAEHPSQVINGLTDRRMLEQHGELATPQAIDDAANAAIHNDARARFVATGLKVLAKSAIPVRDLVKGAKEAAESAIGSKKVGETSPRQYEVAEAKANRQALKDVAKDPKAAVQSQRASLLNNQLAKAARDANAKEVKIVNYLKRFDKPSIAEKLPGSFLEQINAIRDQFDFRQIQTASNRPRENLIKWAEGLRDAGYEPQIADWLAESAQRKHYKELTNNELAGVYDTVRSIEATAKNFREITRNGERVALDGVVDELIAKMDERGEKFTKQDLIDKPNAKTDGKWKAITHWMGVHLRKVDADLLPQEFKINHYDLHDLEGPFREVLFNPVVEANYAKADMTKAVSDAAAKVGEELGKDWQKAMFDLVDNQSLVDPRLASEGSPAPLMKITRAKLLGIMRHLGNESNFDKLTSGYGWEPKAVWDFVMKNATEKDWKATQAHWDSFEPLWAKTEEMIRRIGGVPAPKIPAREFDTPYGKMRGGYSPIDYDPVASKLSERKGEFDLAHGDKVAGENMVYKATTTSNSSMISRSHGYTDYVNLDLHSADARIRDTIHDLAYREALLDTTKVLNNSKFREKFQLTYGKEEYQAMTDWYKNIRDTYLINSKDRGFENALQYTRQGVVLTGIAYRLSTVLKHGSGAALKSLGYLGNAEGAKYFAARVARMSSGHMREEIAGAKEKFAEIRTRMLQMDRDYKQGNRTMLEAEGWREKNDRFGHAMVAWSDALSAIPTAWAAYDLALTSGVPKSMGGNGKPMSEEAAVKYANSVVRQAHGSALEVTRSNFMQSKGVKGLFGTLYGFMNNSYGQTRDMYSKAFQGGAFENNPALVARALAAVVIPGVVAGYASHGGPSEDESWYGWALKSIAGEVAGMVPFVRDAASMLEYGQGGDIAPMRVLKDGYLVGKDVVKEVNGEDSKIIRDLANFIGEVAHIGGLGQGGKTLQYLRDVANGKENPEGAGEFIHDAALGPKHH
jgi:phage-Barnase-EndoU-ColicinE5/D-RelE like nuclease5/Large polyvalent protein associated domain 22